MPDAPEWKPPPGMKRDANQVLGWCFQEYSAGRLAATDPELHAILDVNMKRMSAELWRVVKKRIGED